MAGTLRGVDGARIERSGDRIRLAPATEGIERAEVFLAARAFAPHRHDTYGIGVTTIGVQAFGYRGARHISLPGQLQVLHPGETHDGGPATGRGFGYRILHIAPELVRAAMTSDTALPFVREPVLRRAVPAEARIRALLDDMDEPITDLARIDVATMVATLLGALSGRDAPRSGLDVRAVAIARDHLAAHATEQTTAATLERICGLDRFTLARHFRRAFGTSPDRYRTTRRVAVARSAIERGTPLAEAAVAAGFADQAHMTRQFKRTYGLTPAVWVRLHRDADPRDN